MTRRRVREDMDAHRDAERRRQRRRTGCAGGRDLLLSSVPGKIFKAEERRKNTINSLLGWCPRIDAWFD